MIRIDAFLFDAVNEDKIAAHGLAVLQVSQLLDQEFVVVPNRKARRAAYLVIGRDHGGTCIAVPIEPMTYDQTLWRPITAWRCKDSERSVLDHTRRRR